MKKYAVMVSNESGSWANIEATDLSFERAVEIAADGRADCRPIGRADRSFMRPDGKGNVWNVVPSSKNA